MKIELVEYKYVFNKGNYQSETIGLTARVEEGESTTLVLETLKKIVHGEAQSPVEQKETAPEPKEAPVLKETKAEAPVSEEKPQKPKQVETVPKKKKLNAMATTVYSRENQGHKNMLGDFLSKTFPDWKKTPQKAKDVSAKMEGVDFLDEEGLMLQSFKEKFKEAYNAWKA